MERQLQIPDGKRKSRREQDKHHLNALLPGNSLRRDDFLLVQSPNPVKCGPFSFLISSDRTSQLLPVLIKSVWRTMLFRRQSLNQSLLEINEGAGGRGLFCSLFTEHYSGQFWKARAVILLHLLLFVELCPFKKWNSRVP